MGNLSLLHFAALEQCDFRRFGQRLCITVYLLCDHLDFRPAAEEKELIHSPLSSDPIKEDLPPSK